MIYMHTKKWIHKTPPGFQPTVRESFHAIHIAWYRRTFLFLNQKILNLLPYNIKESLNLKVFLKNIKSRLLKIENVEELTHIVQ